MKFNYILSALVGGALMLGAASCTDEVEYTGADQVAGQGFYLTDTGSADVSIEENATSVAIPVYRTNTQGTATVAITSEITDEDGNPVTDIFTVPDEVTFADGANEANLNVAVDFSKVEALAEYTLTVKLDTDQTTPYAMTECTYTLSYAPWTPWYYYSTTDPGQITYAALTTNSFDWPVIIRYSLVDKTSIQIGIKNPFNNANFGYTFTLKLTPENQYNPGNLPDEDAEYIASLPEDELIDVTKLKMDYYAAATPIDTEVLNTYYNRTMWITDCFTYWTSIRGYSEADARALMQEEGWGESYFSPQTGKFTMFMAPFLPNPDGGVFPTLMAYEYLQLPGIFKDYSMSLQYSGNMVAPNGDETAIITLTRTQDVTAYAYKVFSGQLSDDEINTEVQLLGSDKDTELITEGNTISITPEEAGKYTIVVAGFNSTSELVSSAYLTFTYESVQKENPWKSLGYCEYTDAFLAPDFFEGIDAETWEVEIQESKETPGLYRLVNPYDTWPYNPDGYYSLEGNYYITIDASDPDGVWIPQSVMGININPAFGDLIAWSEAGYEIEVNNTSLAACKQAGLCGTLVDGVITFPDKMLLLGMPATGQIYYANTAGTFCVDMSIIDAHAPQKSAANKPAKISGPITRINAISKGAFKKIERISTKLIDRDELVKRAVVRK